MGKKNAFTIKLERGSCLNLNVTDAHFSVCGGGGKIDQIPELGVRKYVPLKNTFSVSLLFK